MSELLDLNYLLRLTRDAGGSILHINCGLPPVTRDRQTLIPLHEQRFSPDDCDRLAAILLRRQSVLSVKAATVRGKDPELGSYRAEIYRQRDVPNVVVKLQPRTPRSFEDLGLSARLEEMLAPARGLILLFGPGHSGKTWTLGALVDRFHGARPAHSLLLGQVAAFEFPQAQGLLTRHLEEDMEAWTDTLEWARCADLDGVFIDGLHGLSQLETALELAESKLVVASLESRDDLCANIWGVVDRFPAWRHHEIRNRWTEVLRGCLDQRVVAGNTPGAEQLAVAVAVGTPGLCNLVREESYTKLYNTVQTGGRHGMQTLEQSLFQLLRDGLISRETALWATPFPTDVERMIKHAGDR